MANDKQNLEFSISVGKDDLEAKLERLLKMAQQLQSLLGFNLNEGGGGGGGGKSSGSAADVASQSATISMSSAAGLTPTANGGWRNALGQFASPPVAAQFQQGLTLANYAHSALSRSALGLAGNPSVEGALRDAAESTVDRQAIGIVNRSVQQGIFAMQYQAQTGKTLDVNGPELDTAVNIGNARMGMAADSIIHSAHMKALRQSKRVIQRQRRGFSPSSSNLGYDDMEEELAAFDVDEEMYGTPSDFKFGSADWRKSVGRSYRNQWKSGAIMRSTGLGLAVAAHRGVTEYANSEIQFRLTGERNLVNEWQGRGSLAGGITGALIGGALSPILGPYAGYAVAAAGQSIGGAIGGLIGAPEQRQLLGYQSAFGLGATLTMQANNYAFPKQFIQAPAMAYGGGAGTGYSPSLQSLDKSISVNPSIDKSIEIYNTATRRADYISKHHFPFAKAIDGESPYGMSREQLLDTYKSIHGGMMEGGINPNEITGTIPSERAWRDARQNVIIGGNRGGLVSTLATVAGTAVSAGDDLDSKKLSLYQRISENIDRWWGREGVNVAKSSVAPIFATLNKTGGNVNDILLQHGGLNSANFYMAQAGEGESPRYTINQLYAAQNRLQQGERRATMAGLQIRGSGLAMEGALSDREQTLSGLGGTDNIAYMEAHRGRLNATFQKEHETDVLSYGIPSRQLQGIRERGEMMPYSPGRSYRFAFAAMGLRGKQIRTLKDRYRSHMAAGDYSEDQQMAMVDQIEGLKTAQTADLSTLLNGAEDRMMALSANRPSFFSRMDSASLAALSLYRAGSPITKHGSWGGQLRSQNNFIRSISSDDFSGLGAMSPRHNEGMGNGSTASLVNALNRLTQTLDKQSGAIPYSSAKSGQIQAGIGTNTERRNLPNASTAGTN